MTRARLHPLVAVVGRDARHAGDWTTRLILVTRTGSRWVL
jgi:hypothetical protein